MVSLLVLANWVKTLPNERVFVGFSIFVKHATHLTSASHHVEVELVAREACNRSYHHLQFVYCKFQSGDVFPDGSSHVCAGSAPCLSHVSSGLSSCFSDSIINSVLNLFLISMSRYDGQPWFFFFKSKIRQIWTNFKVNELYLWTFLSEVILVCTDWAHILNISSARSRSLVSQFAGKTVKQILTEK